jgi:hypothetical protein
MLGAVKFFLVYHPSSLSTGFDEIVGSRGSCEVANGRSEEELCRFYIR